MSPKTPFRLIAVLLAALLTLNLPMVVSAAEQTDLAHALVPHEHNESAGSPADSSDERHCMPSCQTVAGMLTDPPAAVGRALVSVTLHRPGDIVLRGKNAAPDPPPPRRHPVL